MGVKRKMWRVVKGMYEASKSLVLLNGEKSNIFNVEQGVAQGCSLSSMWIYERVSAITASILQRITLRLIFPCILLLISRLEEW